MSDNDTQILIDSEKRIGTVTKVIALMVDVNLPHGLALSGRRGISRGSVGDFVFIDCDRVVILGRIIEVQIPERSRPTLERQFEQDPDVEPTGRVQLLATIKKTSHQVTRGIEVSPRIGDGVFEAAGSALTIAIQGALFGLYGSNSVQPVSIPIGRLSGMHNMPISIPPESLFGRHCGIFGATGGGKSWTLAKLVTEIENLGGKVILVDPTGEFVGKFPNAEEWGFNGEEDGLNPIHFPIESMTEASLFALLRPTGQSQGPALREAIRSLRLVRAIREDQNIEGVDVQGGTRYKFDSDSIYVRSDGVLIKEGQSIVSYNAAMRSYSEEVNSETCNFDIDVLADQIIAECIWPNDFNSNSVFGKVNQNMLGYCSMLLIRIVSMLKSQELACIFDDSTDSFCDILDSFLEGGSSQVFLISFKSVSFNHNARELLLNMVGEYLLRIARDDAFRDNPVICFLDEAHQFMGRSVGDDHVAVQLDAFGLIAKEGRKYGLTTVIATQRPRDIPQDVLSQVGTFIVHRLTNAHDREAVERVCGELDRSAADFIPSLGQGEAVVLGPELPAPLPVKIDPPNEDSQPASTGPDYQNAWSGS